MKRLVGVPLVLVLLCACGSTRSAAPPAVKDAIGAKGPTGRNASELAALPASVSTPRTEPAAAREARRLLEAYVPPPGALRLRALPKGEHPPRGGIGGIFGRSVERHRLWLVRLPAKALVGYFYHRLHGWHAIAYATYHDCTCRAVTGTAATFGEVGFGGRATGRVLGLVAVKSHRAGWSLLRADVLVVWHLSAAELEHLPAGVREIDIRGPGGKASVRDRDQIRTIVGWFDRFQLYEPPFFAGSCGAGLAPQRVTFIFQGRHRPVARAIVPDMSEACSPASYTIRGHALAPLIARDADRRVQKLLGVKLLP